MKVLLLINDINHMSVTMGPYQIVAMANGPCVRTWRGNKWECSHALIVTITLSL
jgi:hypothetical protein